MPHAARRVRAAGWGDARQGDLHELLGGYHHVRRQRLGVRDLHCAFFSQDADADGDGELGQLEGGRRGRERVGHAVHLLHDKTQNKIVTNKKTKQNSNG